MSQSPSSLDTLLMVRDGQGDYRPATPDQILEAARQVVDQKMPCGAEFSSPAAVKEYLRAKLAGFEHEVFAVLLLDAQHRLIAYVEMFRGTIDCAAVYPREMVKEVLRHNAAAVLLAHYVARHIMRLMCLVFLCGLRSPSEPVSSVSEHGRAT